VYNPDCVMVPVPFETVHVTPVLVDPDTMAENCCCHVSGIATDIGEMLIETVCGADTLTVAEADIALFAALAAVTVYVPAPVGAVYNPLLVIVPPDADHVTAVLLVPEIMAVNCCCPPVWRLAVPGETEIEIWLGCDTVTTADADLVASALLVAVTV
jgi:hypothetical protein